MNIRLMVLFFIFPFFSKAEKRDTIMLSGPSQMRTLEGNAHFLESKPNTSFETIKATRNGWKPYQQSIEGSSGKSFWIKFLIHNNSTSDSTFFVRTSSGYIYNIYFILNETVIHKTSGKLSQSNLKKTKEENINISEFSFPVGANAEVFIESKPYIGPLSFLRVFPLRPVSHSFFMGDSARKNQFLSQHYNHNFNELQIRNLYQGALFLIFFFALFISIQNKESKLYKYYFFYVTGALLFSLLQSRNYTYIGALIKVFPLFKLHGNKLVFGLAIWAYFNFVSEMLNIKSYAPKVHTLVKKVSLLILSLSAFQFLYQILVNDPTLQNHIDFYFQIPIFLFYLWFLRYIYINHKGTLVRYILLGNILLFIFGFIAWAKFLATSPWPGILDHLFVLPLAAVLEIICFSRAVSYKIKEDTNQKIETQRKIGEAEMLALRSQMNPHFIFNSLNSVRNLVIKNQNNDAIKYLTRFSKLVRTVLQQTQKKSITLKEELNTLELYFQSEAERLDKEIALKISIEPKLDLEEIQIPPMLLQPILENAIWHGLLPSTKPLKEITIRIVEEEPYELKVIIEDNGIGREASAKLKSKFNNTHISLGSELTQKRIQLFNENSSMKIELLTENVRENYGTKVILNFRYRNIT